MKLSNGDISHIVEGLRFFARRQDAEARYCPPHLKEKHQTKAAALRKLADRIEASRFSQWTQQ